MAYGKEVDYSPTVDHRGIGDVTVQGMGWLSMNFFAAELFTAA
jgi:hypothetical protein